MNPLDTQSSENPDMAILLRIIIAVIAAGFLYKITGNFVIAIIIGLFLAFPSKKKKKITVSPLFKTPPKIKSIESAFGKTAAKAFTPDASVSEDTLGEERERRRQQTAVKLLIIAAGIGVLIYVLLQNAEPVKEIIEALRTLE